MENKPRKEMKWTVKAMVPEPPLGEYSLEIGIFSDDGKQAKTISIPSDELGYVEKSQIISGLETLLANFRSNNHAK